MDRPHLSFGLVTRVVPDADLLPATYEVARKIAEQSQPAIRMSKRILYQSLDMSLIAHMDMVSSHMAVLRDTPEYKAKLAEFAARRKK
jgi:enoyl-CoA hydratase/carnithine racemase